MPKNVTYVGKHSKDRSLSIYLPKRVYVDEGDGVGAIAGIVKITPEKATSLSSERGLFVGVLCKFIYECYDFDVDVVDHTIYERTLQLYPKTFESPMEPANLQLPDEYHFPFTFQLPQGLPPSISLHLGFIYMGRPIGISYEVFTCIGQLSDIKGKRSSRASMRFRKASYFPMVKDVKPHQEKEKNFIMASNRPLQLKATLDREIYHIGQPINIRVAIHNESKHDVHTIRISAKQVVVARIHGGEKEKYKCQVALLESNLHCPIKRHAKFEETFTVTPKVLESEAYRVAYMGRISLSEASILAPSTRENETPRDRKGLAISYYVNIHACVTMGTDLIVKLPFILSGNERRDDADETVRVIPSQELIDQLMAMGYSMLQATRALSRNVRRRKKLLLFVYLFFLLSC
jgi:S-arrestin